jgi:peptidylprolyl isomerase
MQNDRVKRNILLTVAALGCAALVLVFFCSKSAKQGAVSDITVRSKGQALSEFFGYSFWKDVKQYRTYYSLEDVIKGMRACEANEKPPLDINTEEIRQLTDDLQREIYESTVDDNLEKAAAFLQQISLQSNIVAIQEGQLYYEIVREGEGSRYVEPVSTCLFHYTIKTLDDELVASTYKEENPRKVALDTVIPGFFKGVLGMKKGEKRKLYVHPDQGYQRVNWIVPPQTLLIIDVEVVAFDD